ncbi:MAG: YkgJ family cysteine cluster protein [Candidatus Tectomicrobia bacterium]|uniref:YkgJ family cysteine cluster protein n=1 Tax=Tectimicrobiota bacterium TaxID=2528274 RepID=A0A932CRA6_UNCTE|nr:YkgJ family cysteine cluster protein [Candidatus Tectomicrobia bacterium]
MTVDEKDLIEAIEQLYQEVDGRTACLDRIHGERLRCHCGCRTCCVDGITVYLVEAQNIRCHHAALLANGAPYPEGACAFLDEVGGCRIYEQRPYVCRTQGLPLRWIEELEDGSLVEMRDICPLNEEGEPLERLEEESCWSIGPVEGRLARLQRAAEGGKMGRVGLRALFGRQTPGPGA